MADPECFDADPGQNFHAYADPDSIFFARERNKFFFKILTIFSQNLTNLVMFHFFSNNAG